MGIARNIARLVPNGSGLLPNANIEAMAASKLTGQVADANAPSGSVLQVVQTTTENAVSTSSSSFITSGLTATITPSSSTSKILVLVTNPMRRGAGTVSGMVVAIFRNGSKVYQPMSNLGYTNGNTADLSWLVGCNYLDSPATTSATTYDFRFASGSGTMYAQIDGAGNMSSMILMEIAG
jgi:hypothetical protein